MSCVTSVVWSVAFGSVKSRKSSFIRFWSLLWACLLLMCRLWAGGGGVGRRQVRCTRGWARSLVNLSRVGECVGCERLSSLIYSVAGNRPSPFKY